MQGNIVSGPYYQDAAPDRASLFRGEQPTLIGSDIRGEVMATSDALAKAKISATEALRKMFERDLRPHADETFTHLWQKATALPVAAVPDVKETQHLLTVPQVLRGGAFIAIGFALLCLIGTMASGATLMHPLLALLVLIAGLGFATMSLFGARS